MASLEKPRKLEDTVGKMRRKEHSGKHIEKNSGSEAQRRAASVEARSKTVCKGVRSDTVIYGNISKDSKAEQDLQWEMVN
jgi:hypothetical protein